MHTSGIEVLISFESALQAGRVCCPHCIGKSTLTIASTYPIGYD